MQSTKTLASLLIVALVVAASSCAPESIPEANAAGIASGLYKGTLTVSGEVFENEEIELHKIMDDLLNVSTADPEGTGGQRLVGFEIKVVKSGAAIHHVLGTEHRGTFVVDLGTGPDEIRFDMPNGTSFDGWRVRGYNE